MHTPKDGRESRGGREREKKYAYLKGREGEEVREGERKNMHTP